MALAFVNDTTSVQTGVNSTSLTITYSPTAGNEISIFVYDAVTTDTVTIADNNSNALTKNASSLLYWQFYGKAITGATSYKLSGLSAFACIVAILVEYSGQATSPIGASAQTNTGTSTTPSIAVTTTGANSFIIAGLGIEPILSGITWTANTGNLRANANTGVTASWIASHAYVLGNTLIDSNGNVQICTTAGTSRSVASGHPSWATTIGTATTDNTAHWTCCLESGNIAVVDNTSASSGASVTCSGTISTSEAWRAIAFELLAPSSVSVIPQLACCGAGSQ